MKEKFFYHSVKKKLLSAFQNYSNNTALIIGENKISYALLHLKSKLLYNEIIQTEETNNNKVAIFTQRDEAAFVSVLTSILGNYTYVPVNPKFPDERILAIVSSANINLIITCKVNYLRIQNLLSKTNNQNIRLIVYDYYDVHLCSNNEIIDYDCKTLPNNYVYLLFTSGSTGRPKGVQISYRNLFYFLESANKYYQITPVDFVSQTFDLSFDLSVFDLLMTWINGACLCCMGEYDLLNPTNYLITYQISIWFSVPTLISRMKTFGCRYPKFRTIRLSLFCGEKLMQKDVTFWHNLAPNSLIENLYGPTEATIACTRYKWNNALKECDVVPIGTPFSNIDYIILDCRNSGENKYDMKTGELCIAGAQIFEGYLNNDKDPFIELNNKKYYRTGDLVKEMPNGTIHYISRLDNQIKINGYRVELEEIELILKAVDKVINAAVCFHTEWKVIVAVVEALISDEKEIYNFLKQKLPLYMIPNKIKIIQHQLPLNTNGKIDRKKVLQYF